MDWKSFAIGFGIPASLAFMALPEMLGYGNQSKPTPRPSLPIERVSDESDEAISLAKNYKPPDQWRWQQMIKEDCEPWPIGCHVHFERPIGPPPDWEEAPRPRPIVHRGLRGPYGGPAR